MFLRYRSLFKNFIEEYCATSLSNFTLPRTAGDPYYPILHLNPIPSITCMLRIGHHHIIQICKNISSLMSLMHPAPSSYHPCPSSHITHVRYPHSSMISFIIASPPLRNICTNMSMLGHRGKGCRPKGRDRPAKKAKTERRRLSSQRPRKRNDTNPAGVREPKIWCEVSFLLTHEFLYSD
jgi:hypothetical protein